MKKCALQDLGKKCDEVSNILKTLSHPQRLLLLCHLSDGTKTVSELHNLTELSQPNVSQFLNKMKDQGLVKVKKEKNFSHYSIKDEKILKLLNSFQKIFC